MKLPLAPVRQLESGYSIVSAVQSCIAALHQLQPSANPFMNACIATDNLAWAMIVLGIATFAFLSTGFRAPYGRHKIEKYAWEIPGRFAWVSQEISACLIPATLFLCNPATAQKLPLALLVSHYVYRSVIYPFWLRQPKGTPFHVWLAAAGFVCCNSVLQGTHLVYCHHEPVTLASSVLGVSLWVLGLSINITSDRTLQNLRRKRPQKGLGYRIPRGGMYELISCPNYLGETIEWVGYAITTGSIVGTAFAFYTFANLAPRAHQHHQWYQETFPDYPANRKAYIPCIW